MVTLHNYDEVLVYVLRLGFVNRDNAITYQQADLCYIANKLCEAAGITGKWKQGITFQAHFHRYVADSGYHFPYLGHFTIVRQDGTRYTIRDGSIYQD